MVTATQTAPSPLNQRLVEEIADLFKTLSPQEQAAVELLVERQRIENLKGELEVKKREIDNAQDDLDSLWDERNSIFEEIRLVEVKEDFFYNRISSRARDLFMENPLAETREEIDGDIVMTDAEIREFYSKLAASGTISMEDARYFFGFRTGNRLARLYCGIKTDVPYGDKFEYDKNNKEFRLVR